MSRSEMISLPRVLAEAQRLNLMRGLEEQLWMAGYGRIAGVDEAGRGCLAGPVVAGAVVVEGDRWVPGVDDSKCLRWEKRERLAVAIREAHPNSAIGVVSPREIDRMNILEATRCAMVKALQGLREAPDLAVIDAVRLSGLPFPCLPVIRGDHISYAVACGSILAKVERDRMMVDLDRRFPQYGFASNKGYGAPAHRQALVDFGPTSVHRLTFRSVLPRPDLPHPKTASSAEARS